ncbi:MAG TPA: DEAD/DEAH box helicase, partial [Firmicutes bacterium]|nr:DEAD/DEAH box helicase [Bacillota bacterium]
MSLDPLKATKNVVDKYISYLETTFAFSDKELHCQLMHELRQPGKFAKGPILEATPPFEGGCSVEDFINEGVLSAQFRLLNVPELPVERNLYLHQEQAVRKLVTEKRNIIVSTGTGSGKTETFLLPILNHLFRQKEQGKLGPGVRALLLYPMNALANDQLKRLRKLLKNYPDITFGSYTGETEHSEQQAVERFRKMYPRERILENELLSRDQMKETPPHILLTNYAMLE